MLGFIGLGRMGKNIVLNLSEKNFPIAVFNRTKTAYEGLPQQVKTTQSIEEFCSSLSKPRVVWLMVSAGQPVDDVISELLPFLEKGDVVVDGGNSFYKDSLRRFKLLKKKKVHFFDVGTSGGLEGARRGACLTIGGEKEHFSFIEGYCRAMACENGYAFVGAPGAGHFVKMVHNGIEYGLLQAYGEGFEVLEKSPYELDFQQISAVWSNGSIVRSYLLELMHRAFLKDAKLSSIKGVVGGGETGSWALKTASREKVPSPVLKASLKARKDSANKPDAFSGKVIAATRNEFGGHEVVRNEVVKA